jgi:hypothetical protein
LYLFDSFFTALVSHAKKNLAALVTDSKAFLVGPKMKMMKKFQEVGLPQLKLRCTT